MKWPPLQLFRSLWCFCWPCVCSALPSPSWSRSTTVSATRMRPTWGPGASTPATLQAVSLLVRTPGERLEKFLMVPSELLVKVLFLRLFFSPSLTAILSLLVLIFSVCNVFLANSAGVLVTREQYVVLDAPVTTMQVGYFMTIPYLVLSLVACAVVYIYHHMAYRQSTQQQKPTEDAPMETMMY